MKFFNLLKYASVTLVIISVPYILFSKQSIIKFEDAWFNAEKNGLSNNLTQLPPSLRYLWTNREHANMLDLIKTVMKAMSDGNVPCFINYGTLLGSLRHHDIIPWDDDIDLGAPMIHKADIILVLNKLVSLKYEHTWTASTQIRIFGPYSKLYSVNWPWRWPYIDVDLYSENTTHIWFYNSGAIYTHPKLKVFPLHKRPLGNLLVNSPRDSFDCLSRMFSDLQMCSTGLNHRLGVPSDPPTSCTCDKLANFHAFVHRSHVVDKGVVEAVKLADVILSTFVSAEPNYTARISAYSLKLV